MKAGCLLQRLMTSVGCSVARRTFTTLKEECAVHLDHRTLVKIHGKDTLKHLQGLLTNDVNVLEREKLMYSMLLSTQGRVLYDVFLHVDEHDGYLIECDTQICDELIAHLKKYKLRAKVYFERRYDLNVYSLLHCNSPPFSSCHIDPRLSALGYRVITDKLQSGFPIAEKSVYNTHRYELGITEGVDELANAIPLEHNAALLNGVSFTKGCYIGQELVARAHHTGVIRKRIMPLDISSPATGVICNENNKNVGKVLACEDNRAVGLMRLKEVVGGETKFFMKDDTSVVVVPRKPDWWPCDLTF